MSARNDIELKQRDLDSPLPASSNFAETFNVWKCNSNGIKFQNIVLVLCIVAYLILSSLLLSGFSQTAQSFLDTQRDRQIITIVDGLFLPLVTADQAGQLLHIFRTTNDTLSADFQQQYIIYSTSIAKFSASLQSLQSLSLPIASKLISLSDQYMLYSGTANEMLNLSLTGRINSNAALERFGLLVAQFADERTVAITVRAKSNSDLLDIAFVLQLVSIALIALLLGTLVFTWRERLVLLSESMLEMSEQKHKLEEALQAKGDFLAVMTHELRTPLNGILGSLQLMPDAESLHERDVLIESATESAELLLAVINDVLDFQSLATCIVPLTPAWISLTQFVDDVAGLLGPPMRGKQLNFSAQLLPQLLPLFFVKVDPVRLRQILLNILGNALKFTLPGGSVQFRVRLLKVCRASLHPRFRARPAAPAEEDLEQQDVLDGNFIDHDPFGNTLSNTTRRSECKSQVMHKQAKAALNLEMTMNTSCAALSLPLLQSVGTFRFEVLDTGIQLNSIGIPANKLATIFEAFNSVDQSVTRSSDGSGLGLAISSQLAKRMEGKIFCESKLNEGSMFCFEVDFDMTHSKQIDLVTLNAITLASETAAVRYAGPSNLRGNAHIGRNFVMGPGSCFDTAALATITEDCDLTSPCDGGAYGKVSTTSSPNRISHPSGYSAASEASLWLGVSGGSKPSVKSDPEITDNQLTLEIADGAAQEAQRNLRSVTFQAGDVMNQPSGALNTTLANVHIQLPRSILSASGRRLSGNSGHSNVNAVGVSCGAAATSSHSPTGSSFSDNASRNNLAGVVSCTGSIGAKRGLRNNGPVRVVGSSFVAVNNLDSALLLLDTPAPPHRTPHMRMSSSSHSPSLDRDGFSGCAVAMDSVAININNSLTMIPPYNPASSTAAIKTISTAITCDTTMHCSTAADVVHPVIVDPCLLSDPVLFDVLPSDSVPESKADSVLVSSILASPEVESAHPTLDSTIPSLREATLLTVSLPVSVMSPPATKSVLTTTSNLPVAASALSRKPLLVSSMAARARLSTTPLPRPALALPRATASNLPVNIGRSQKVEQLESSVSLPLVTSLSTVVNSIASPPPLMDAMTGVSTEPESPIGTSLIHRLSYSVLLVEDNQLNQRFIITILTKLGHTVSLAENGQEAVDKWRQRWTLGERFDICLMDISMPVMDGMAAAAEIRRLESELGRDKLPIIAVTANAAIGFKQKCLNVGMQGVYSRQDYICKPIHKNELVAKMGQHAVVVSAVAIASANSDL